MVDESPVIEIADLSFTWKKQAKPVLNIAALQINQGERVFLRGPSGSGKSTLLNLLAGVALPQAGVLKVLGQELSALGSAQRDHFRAHHIGFIFQIDRLKRIINLKVGYYFNILFCPYNEMPKLCKYY